MRSHLLFLVLNLALSCSIAQAAHTVITIADKFGTMDYSLTIFNLQAYIHESVIATHTDLSQPGLFTLQAKAKGSKTQGRQSLYDYEYYQKMSPATELITKNGQGKLRFTKQPHPRVEETLKFMRNQSDKNNQYYVKLIEQGGCKKTTVRNTITEEAFFHIPELIAKTTDEKKHPRHNLCDMITECLDHHLLDFGILQAISHDSAAFTSEQQDEISMLVAIHSTKNPEYNSLGLMQYTFDKNNICYHRAYKPITPSSILRLSNTPTQWIMQYAIYYLFEDASNDCTTPEAAAMWSFLNKLPAEDYKNLRSSMESIPF